MSKIIDEIIRREGGFVNNQSDRGGPTNYGITAKTLGEYRKLCRDATVNEVKYLTESEARDIYQDEYITKPGFLAISYEPLRELLIDSGVNSGTNRAARWLQTALGMAVIDGVVGQKTINAINASDQKDVYYKVVGGRLRHLGRLITKDQSQAAFAAGWMNRVSEFL